MTYKVFVKYNSGQGGQFLSTLLLSLMKPMNLHNQIITSIHAEHITDLSHTFKLVWPQYVYKNENDIFSNGNNKIEHIFKHMQVEFFETNLPSYIIPTHWLGIYKGIPYIENAKVIHIYANEEDYDQIQYNVAYKLLYRDAKAISSTNNIDKSLALISYLNRNVESIKEKYSNKLKDINTINDIDLSDDDCIRLLNWIVKFGSITVILSKIPNLNPDTNLHVNFRDIHNGNIVNQLDELAAFIGIEHLSDERRNNAIELINKYVAGQKDIPWKLSIDDY